MDVGYAISRNKDFQEYLSPSKVRTQKSLEKKILRTNNKGKPVDSDNSSDMLDEFDSEDINELEKDTLANRKKPGYSFEDLSNIKKI